MKNNLFTKKSLVKDFPWLSRFLEGQNEVRIWDCAKCGRACSISYPLQVRMSDPNPPQWGTCECGEELRLFKAKVFQPGIAPCNPEEITIKKVDETFLRSIPEDYSWDGSMVGISRGSEISFVFRSQPPTIPPLFEIIKNAVKPDYTSGSNYAHSGTHSEDGETVAHAIERRGCKDWAWEAMLEYQYGIHCVEHHSSGCRLIVWKAGKADGTIRAVIDRLYQEAEDQAAAEAAV